MKVSNASVLIVLVTVGLAAIESCSAEPTTLRSSENTALPNGALFLPTTTGDFAKAQAEGRTQLSALLEGVVTATDGCILINDLNVLWPAGFSAAKDGSAVVILDGSGVEVARVGESVSVGGGSYPEGTFPRNGVCDRESGTFVINTDAFIELPS